MKPMAMDWDCALANKAGKILLDAVVLVVERTGSARSSRLARSRSTGLIDDELIADD